VKSNMKIRRIHRVLAIAFTLTVIVNFAVRIRAEPPAWITYSPLPPLFLLMFTGLYMFSLPYFARRRAS
jgi:membrane protein CcdC involved in cytochrome C biogenesis